MNRISSIPANELGKMFFALESRGYPVIQRVHFDLQGGSVDIDVLRRAYLLEILRHPLFNAFLESRCTLFSWNARWIPRDAPDADQALGFHDFSGLAPDAAEAKVLEILLDPFPHYSSAGRLPVFLTLCKLPDAKYKLIAFFNHVSTDAGGAFLFLRNLFLRYSSLVFSEASDSAQQLFLTPVMTSSLFPAGITGGISHFLRALCVLLAHALKRKGAATKMLYGESSFSGGIAAVLRRISPERMKQYLAAARFFETTFTGFFTAAQILSVCRWKKLRQEPCGTISVQIHKNLRKTADELQELQNNFSVFFVRAAGKDCDNPRQLISVVRREFHGAARHAIAEKLIGLLWPLRFNLPRRLLALLIKRFFILPDSGDSFQISNVGSIFREPSGATLITSLGDSEITACYCTSRPVPSMGNFTSLATFRESLFLSFNYCTWSMEKAAAEQYVDMLEQALEDLSACAAI